MILHIQNCYIFIFRFAKGTHNFKKNDQNELSYGKYPFLNGKTIMFINMARIFMFLVDLFIHHIKNKE